MAILLKFWACRTFIQLGWRVLWFFDGVLLTKLVFWSKWYFRFCRLERIVQSQSSGGHPWSSLADGAKPEIIISLHNKKS